MKNCAYYSRPSLPMSKDSCSIQSDQLPLIVNCAGCNAEQINFRNYNLRGRKDYYLIYTTEGSLTFLFENEFLHTVPGTVFILPPHYKYHLYSDSAHPITYFWIHFTGSAVDSILEGYLLGNPPLQCKIGVNANIISKIQMIFDSFSNGDLFQRQELAARLDSVFRAIARLHSISQNKSTQKIQQSLRYIGSNYHKKILVSKLAQIENLSVSRYCALFRNLIGMPPSQYIIDLKLKNACELLAESNYSIKKIGNSVGYNDAQMFSNFFRKHLGISPSDYRKRNLNADIPGDILKTE